MKRSFVLLGGVATLMLGAASCSSKPDSVVQAQDANNAKLGITNPDTTVTTAKTVGGEQRPAFDSEFMTKAASGGLLEVQLGQQVAQKATTPDAKQFAQQMVTDHTKANNELKALAAQKNITLPTTLGAEQQKVYDEVLAEKGADLDKKIRECHAHRPPRRHQAVPGGRDQGGRCRYQDLRAEKPAGAADAPRDAAEDAARSGG